MFDPKAYVPTLVFLEPLVFAVRVKKPIAVFSVPVAVLAFNADTPKAVLDTT